MEVPGAGVRTGAMIPNGGGKGLGDGAGEDGDGGVGELLQFVTAGGKGGGGGIGEVGGVAGFGVEGDANAEPGAGRMPSHIANHGFQVCLGMALLLGAGEGGMVQLELLFSMFFN